MRLKDLQSLLKVVNNNIGVATLEKRRKARQLKTRTIHVRLDLNNKSEHIETYRYEYDMSNHAKCNGHLIHNLQHRLGHSINI